MTLHLTLVRHGQTQYNAARRLQGRCDSPLTRTGVAGVRVTAQHLSARPFTEVYTSPQGRAVTTAIEIARHHPGLGRLHTDPDLREFAFGCWEGRPEAELEAATPWHELVPAILDGTFAGFPRGESGAEFMARVRGVFDRIVTRHEDGEVLVVGHGLTLGAWLTTLDPTLTAGLPNASVTRVRVDAQGAQVLEVGTDVAGHGGLATRPVVAPVAV